MRLFELTALAIVSCLLPACGGGGGGSITFLNQLVVTPDGIFVGESSTVVAEVALQRDSATTVRSVTLLKVDGTAETELATLVDDATGGDAVANDNIYTASVSLNESSVGLLTVKAKVEAVQGGREFSTDSEIQTIAVMERLTDAEWDIILGTPDAAKAFYDSSAGTDEEKMAATAAFVETLDGIAKAGGSEHGHGIWIVYESGVLGGVIFNQEDDSVTHKGGVPRPGRSRPQSVAAFESAPDENTIQSKSALYLGPYLWQFGEDDDFHGAWAKIQQSICPKFDLKEVTNFSKGDQGVTPEDFKTLSRYGLIVISTHGDTWFNGLFSLWTDLFGEEADDVARINPFTDDESVVVMSTGFKLNDSNRTTYENDLQQHRLVVGVSDTLLVTPAFIAEYNGSFPNSIVYLGSCRSLFNDSMANVFLDNGAGSVLGFSDYVLTTYTKNVGEKTFDTSDGLLDLTPDVTPLSAAHIAAIVTHGDSDSSTPPAFYEVRAERDGNLSVAPLIDGGFEEGDLSRWLFTGEGLVQPYLGDVLPPEGFFMGCVTTHFARPTDTGFFDVEVGGFSSVQQSLCIPTGVTMLRLQYEAISEEPLCGLDERFGDGDSFSVDLFDSDFNFLLADLQFTGTTEWTFLGGDYFVQGDNFSTPGECHPEENSRDDGTYHTGWREVSVDVSSYAGRDTPLTLSLSVNDAGDLIYETVVCVDDVRLE
jgi:hypothetical protein